MLEPKCPPHLSDNSKVHRTSLDTELNSAWEYQSAKYCHSGPVTFATIIGRLDMQIADSRVALYTSTLTLSFVYSINQSEACAESDGPIRAQGLLSVSMLS